MKKLVPYLPFYTLLLLPMLLYPIVNTSGWISNSDIHASLEFAASLLAVTAGIMVLLHFFSTGRLFFLIISMGFVLISSEEFVHAIFSFNRIWSEIPPHFKLAISSTWLTGRFILVVSFFAALLFENKEITPTKRIRFAVEYSVIGLIFAACVTLLILNFPALPSFVLLGSITKKLIELSLALLFFVAFVIYSNIYVKQKNRSPLLWGITASIIFQVLAHIFVFDAQVFYDLHWDTAHLIVVLSYFFPIFGVWGETLILSKASQTRVVELGKEIAERKKAEKALLENEERLERIVTTIPDGITMVDHSGQITFANSAAEKILGLARSGITNRIYNDPSWEITAVDGSEFPDEQLPFNRVLLTNKPVYGIEHAIKHPDGKRIILSINSGPLSDTDGNFIGMVSSLNDITERKQVEEALRVSEEKWRNLFEILPVGVSIINSNNTVTELNSALSQILDISKVGLLNGDYRRRKYFRSDNTPMSAEEFPSTRAAKEQKIIRNIEIGVEKENGTIIWTDVSAAPLFSGGSVTLTVDITERKRAEENFFAAQQELERSHKALLGVAKDQKEAEEQVRQLNAELDQRVKERTAQLEAAKQELEAFSYSVSHDLRAPLRALDGFSAALISDYQDKLDQQAQSYLTRIQEASRRMGQLIEDLLNLSRITCREVKLDRVDLSLLAMQIASELHSQTPERQVEFEISPDLVVRADPGLIKIAMENLLNNALKFSSKKETALIQVGVLDGSEGRVYFVRDNGAGFDMAYAHKLFTPFQRLHGTQEFSGTGIGLTIVQRIIARHGGRIWTEAAVNLGATFYFTLGGE